MGLQGRGGGNSERERIVGGVNEKMSEENLGMKRPSEHCKDKQEELIAIDHTGYGVWLCDCGRRSGWEKL